ncbi:MAG TPA: SDR family oxidoreductase [Bacteroidia bacterium]|jgi:thioester reductase-like protein|nr:SDR family oxidoreductase [Bacteroidia bacterium]
MNIFITGTTGFLGGELLIDLSKRKEINKLYCLVRADSEHDALLRLKRVFDLRGDQFDSKKVIPVLGNLGENGLCDSLTANKIINDTNVIIHSAANTSFSRIYDKIVEQVNITGVQELIDWSLNLPSLATFLYIGTASICGKEAINRIIKEEESPNIKVHHVVKYTYTKMMGEIMLREQLPHEKILIVRPSIIMGDSRDWIPRSYVILWALATVNLLRLIPVNGQSNLDAIPVDYASKAIIALLFATRNHTTYHVSSGPESATNSFKVTASIDKILTGPIPYKFVDKAFIKQMKLWAKNALPLGSELHKYNNYLDYWKQALGDTSRIRILLAALEPYLEFAELGQVFDNSKLLKDTGIGLPEPAHIYIERSAKYLKNIDVFAGALDS